MLNIVDEGESFNIFLQSASDLPFVSPVVLDYLNCHFILEQILNLGEFGMAL